MKLTKNFSKSEFECKCGCDMPKDVLDNIKIVAEQLQIVRNKLNKAIKIHSAYRCKYHNDITVKGSKNSQHKLGKAADVVIKDIRVKDTYNFLNQLMENGTIINGGLGSYNNFTHYDIRDKKARW